MAMTSEDHLKQLFPRLRCSPFEITSNKDEEYNCVAWAVHDTTEWWEPFLYYWPKEVLQGYSIENYILLYEFLGFEKCRDDDYEEGYEKIALYAKGSFFKHVSRQLKNGKWASKIGGLEDIEHSQEALSGNEYGEIVVLMKKRI